MGDLYAALDKGEFFWFRCHGPDGLCWLLARHLNVCGTHLVDLPQDRRECQPLEAHDDGSFWVHKWRIIQVHSAPHPGASRDWLWCDEGGRLGALKGEVQDG